MGLSPTVADVILLEKGYTKLSNQVTPKRLKRKIVMGLLQRKMQANVIWLLT